MNQAILFADIQTWDEKRQSIRFPAQQSGGLVECFVSTLELEKLAGQKINTPQQALDLFSHHRFEIEELAEELIEAEAFNEQGYLEVVS
ncbi:DUF1488 domain-containing protein [Vibrio ostreicida]|uniref:DUF1488 domain-containing protein n=1 Tax=Vibrio ostreicida TaxID=526588 RepID=A0ABT8BNC0_9VIBR|nr:DUF1488 domain-containing protein [Vibrio ostreicida]MDN3608580.1 DUF1488 domain-containing protein [Vibrio ostreicida]NPD10975.1 DUF1488 domain-containing protein [Vibrio ostreicida]